MSEPSFDWSEFESDFAAYADKVKALEGYCRQVAANGKLLALLALEFGYSFDAETFVLTTLTASFASAEAFYTALLADGRLVRHLVADIDRGL